MHNIIDPCENEPCQNGGTCNSNADQTFTCNCHPAHTGSLCQNLTDPCTLDPCLNGGTCTNIGESSYMCDCGIEFTGQDCSVSIDHCTLSSPNCNNGSCVDGFGTFACQCNPGYTGDFCDVDIDECLTAGCQNGGCKDLVNDFQCLCYLGWTGRLCETDIDYCHFNTSPAGLCSDVGAIRCIDGNYTYICTCVSGNNSSQDVNELRFYLDQQSNLCERQCPLFYFGNHTGGLCQPCRLHIRKDNDCMHSRYIFFKFLQFQICTAYRLMPLLTLVVF